MQFLRVALRQVDVTHVALLLIATAAIEHMSIDSSKYNHHVNAGGQLGQVTVLRRKA